MGGCWSRRSRSCSGTRFGRSVRGSRRSCRRIFRRRCRRRRWRRVDFAPTEAERVAATVAAHPELSEAAARSTVSAGVERGEAVGEEDRSFAPPADVERPRWGGEGEVAEESGESVAEVEVAEVEGEVSFAPPEGAARPGWSRDGESEEVEEEEAELVLVEDSEDEGELVVEEAGGDDSGSEGEVAEVGGERRSEWARPQKTEL